MVLLLIIKILKNYSDKVNYRTTGPMTATTKQPTKGRANGGGLRIGEMETNAILGHGLGSFLKESMMERSDKYNYYIVLKLIGEKMGYLFALLSAVSWTIGTISFKKSNNILSPHILNLYKNLLAFLLY